MNDENDNSTKRGPAAKPEGGRVDRYDPERLRLSQDFEVQLGAKKTAITVPVRKPDRQSFIRVHPDSQFRLETYVLELKEERESYLVDPPLVPELLGEVIAKCIHTAVNRQGVLFLWPIRLPAPDGRLDSWNQSALEIAQMAIRAWVRVVPNLSLGAYEVFEATGNFPEPDWSEMSFRQILELAFKDRFIDRLDHPAIRRLRGQI